MSDPVDTAKTSSSAFTSMSVLSHKGLFAIALVVDVALQKDKRLVSAKTLAARHGLQPRHLELLLRSLVRGGILNGVRGPHGGYELARQPHNVTIQDILRAASIAHGAEEEPNSDLAKVVLPILSVAEQEFGQALTRISLDDMVQRAVVNGLENKNGEQHGGDE